MIVYAIFDDCNYATYICYGYTDEEYEYYEQVEDMNDWDWDEWLSNE